MKLKQKFFSFEYVLAIYLALQLLPFYTLPPVTSIVLLILLLITKYHFEAFRFNYFIYPLAQIIILATSNIYFRITAILLVIFLIDLLPVYEYPEPTGKYKVGYKSIHQGEGKNLHIAVFYPTTEQDFANRNKHFDYLMEFSKRNYDGFCLIVSRYFPPLLLLPKFLIDIAHTFFKRLFLNVTIDAELIANPATGDKYPVIVFSHGLGAFNHLMSLYFREWASHGYIVFSVDHDEQIYLKWKKYRDFVSVRVPQLEVRKKQIKSALDYVYNPGKIDQLFNRKISLDYDKVFMAGHSFGSATSVTVAHDDSRITAGLILLDPWLDPCGDHVFQKPIGKPIVLIRSVQLDKMKPVRAKVLKFVEVNRGMIFSGHYKNTTHNDVTDFMLTKPKDPRHVLRLSRTSDKTNREHQMIKHYTITNKFLESILKEKTSEDYSHVIDEIRNLVQDLVSKYGKDGDFIYDV